MIIQFCGLSGVGKTTLALRTQEALQEKGIRSEVLDGDLYRGKLFKELKFSKSDRQENLRRLGFVASRFSQQGIVALMSVINPYEETRRELCELYDNVKTVFLDCPVSELLKRDTKGLYRRALLPENDPAKIHNLTGINDAFETPEHPDLHLNTASTSVMTCTKAIVRMVSDYVPAGFRFDYPRFTAGIYGK